MTTSSSPVSTTGQVDADGLAQLAATVESSHDAIITIGLDGTISRWNPGASRLYGYPAAEAIGLHAVVLTDADSRASEVARFDRVAAGERIEMFGAKRVQSGGAIIRVSVTLAPIVNDDGSIVGISSVSRELGDLASAQGRSRRIMESAVEAMLSVDADGIITLVSDQVELLFGFERSELINQPVEMLIPTLERDISAALRRGYVANATARPMGGSKLSARRKDGTSFPADISLSSSDVGGSLLVTVTPGDVSTQTAVEGSRRDSEARARQLADSVDVAFLLRGLNPSVLQYVSPGYEKIFGSVPIIDQPDPTVSLSQIHPEDRARFEVDYMSLAQVGMAARAEYRVVRADGEVRWVRAMTWPMADSDGRVRRAATTIEDITERRLAEAALRTARTEAEKARAAKNEFLSRTSHELRTPLNAVLGFAQLLELEPLTDDQQDSVDHILVGGRHLLGLIDDVLDIAMIEGDRMDLTIEPVRVSDLIVETVELMAPLADTAGVTLAYKPSRDGNLRVSCDDRRLRQVMLNLLSNAIKYNRPGGRVDIACETRHDTVDIVVQDTGHGIRAEDVHRLFTPFDRLGAQATAIEGTGVGLALSHLLMDRMGGALGATSEIDVGSTFTASIPHAAAQPPREESTMTPKSAGISSNGRGLPRKTLLYIEDNTSNILLMRRLVAHRPGWRMTVADHGAAGLAVAAAESLDLVLLDLHLPDMDGHDVLRRLKDGFGASPVPIVVVSADANPHQIKRLLESGAHRYLTKPLVVANVLDILDSIEPPSGVPDSDGARRRSSRISDNG